MWLCKMMMMPLNQLTTAVSPGQRRPKQRRNPRLRRRQNARGRRRAHHLKGLGEVTPLPTPEHIGKFSSFQPPAFLSYVFFCFGAIDYIDNIKSIDYALQCVSDENQSRTWNVWSTVRLLRCPSWINALVRQVTHIFSWLRALDPAHFSSVLENRMEKPMVMAYLLMMTGVCPAEKPPAYLD